MTRDEITKRAALYAQSILRHYRLSPEERAQELEALAECVASVTEMCLENLSHRQEGVRG